MMQTHVIAMLQLLNPNQSGPVQLPPVTPIPVTVQEDIFRSSILKDIAIESRGTAQFMATDNLVSAMQMKVPAVKNAHINMAWQQTQIADFYNELISQIGWEHPPAASAQEQLLMIQQFQHIVQEQPSLYQM
jgi:spore coat protein CotF